MSNPDFFDQWIESLFRWFAHSGAVMPSWLYQYGLANEELCEKYGLGGNSRYLEFTPKAKWLGTRYE